MHEEEVDVRAAQVIQDLRGLGKRLIETKRQRQPAWPYFGDDEDVPAAHAARAYRLAHTLVAPVGERAVKATAAQLKPLQRRRK